MPPDAELLLSQGTVESVQAGCDSCTYFP